jgi:hypothetical protein
MHASTGIGFITSVILLFLILIFPLDWIASIKDAYDIAIEI